MVNQLKLTAPLAAYTGVRDENIRRMYRLLEIAPIIFFVYTVVTVVSFAIYF